MLHKEHELLTNCIDSLKSELKKLTDILSGLIDYPGKSFIITMRNKTYVFNPVLTRKELNKRIKNRDKIVRYLIQDCMTEYVSKNSSQDCFDALFALVNGEDPKDHQFEKIESVDVDQSNMLQNESGHKAVELDIDTYNMIMENDNIEDKQKYLIQKLDKNNL